MKHRKHSHGKKQEVSGSRRRKILPVTFIFLSFLLMILPLEGFVASVKAVLSYVFIPQIRLSHASAEYASDVKRTVRELLDAHRENEALKQQGEELQLLQAQAKDVMAENERLSRILKLNPVAKWNGVWAKVAYREPVQWNTVILDKGSDSGIEPRSAVVALQQDQVALAGVVVEVTASTAKVLLVRDEDFSAVVYLENTKEEGLLNGASARPVKLKYVPLLSPVKVGERVYTAASSSIFPAGILVGEVGSVRNDESFQTALTIEVDPFLRPGTLKEVFVITGKTPGKGN